MGHLTQALMVIGVALSEIVLMGQRRITMNRLYHGE